MILYHGALADAAQASRGRVVACAIVKQVPAVMVFTQEKAKA